ncbi:ROK family transcriptional regulator [Paenibacillus sp. GD4]|uniref:ROK family transcriptional regulator n=1 Tax=Paenibacillus sp. GD4 TaxID=3068890 RepID=UPI002796AB4B|nr:ROK family transcriptional regulator [Paenibacillus sp. GD4]MDQ1913442.1 ROK family transcriptional regulator [Paenibacillus sp. GD4]
MKRVGHNTARTKQMNRSLVLQTLFRHSLISRQEIAELTKLTPATITNITRELMNDNLITEAGSLSASGTGRRRIGMELNADAYWVLGVHISLRRLEIGSVNLKGEVEDPEVHELSSLNTEEFLRLLQELLERYISNRPGRIFRAIGAGIFGFVSFRTGVVNWIHSGWTHIPLAAWLEERFGLPAYVDNNVRAMALGEKMFGDSKDISDFMSVFIGTGIGSGLVINDTIFRSGYMETGEFGFGHMTYIPDGIPCWCGNRGCLERYASESSILETLGLSKMDELLSKYREQDPKAVALLHETGRIIGKVLVSFLNMLHVKRIVIGGRLASKELPLLKEIREIVRERSVTMRYSQIEITASTLGREIGMISAAALAMHGEFFGEPT